MPGRPTAAKRAQSPRRSHHSPRRSIPYRPRPLPAFERPVISPEELATLPDILKEECGWEGELRPFQASTLEELAAGRDVVLHSATGSGKTLTLAALHKLPSTKGMVTLCASPLIALQDEQVETMRKEFKLEAVAINSAHDENLNTVLEDIVHGKYSIVFLSPEMLQSRRFISKVLQYPGFSKRVLNLAVDEAHCVSHWGDSFRKKYGSLGNIRAFLPRSTPVIAVSATLTPRVRRDIASKLHLNPNYTFLNIGNDRPNVSLIVRQMEHAMNTHLDASFIIPQNYASTAKIPKTLVYVDSIEGGSDLIDYLVTLLKVEDQRSGVIRPFNAVHSHDFRKRVMEQFLDSSVRVLVCTDAAGMGCNIPDVEVVVQWKLPKNLDSFVQRAGRSARARGGKGVAILLVEPSAYANKKQSGASERTDLDEFIALDAACRRKVLASVYETKLGEERLPVSCCDRCAPDLLLRSAPHEAATAPKRKSGVTKGVVRPAVRDALFDWREDVHLKHHSEAMYDATAILSDDSVELLSAIGTVENIEVLKKALAADDWYWWSKHGEELFKLLHGLRIPPLERLPPKAKGPAKRKHDDSDMLVETQPASTSTKRAKNSGPDAVPALSQVPPSPAPPPVTVPPSIQRPPPTPLHPSATSSYPPSTPQARPLPYNAHVAPYGGGPLPIGSGYTRSYITPQQPYNQSYSRPSSYSYGLPTPTTTARSATAASCPQSLPAQTTPIHKPPNPNQQHAPNASSSKR